MSTYYGLHCSECLVSSDHWLNHGDRVLSDLVHGYPLIKDFKKQFEQCGVDISFDLCSNQSGEILSFIEQHENHILHLEDEYRNRTPLLGIEYNKSDVS